MVSINTNLSSLMVQANLTNSTNGLNKAIERLSTGYKINHSSDNAANYSIANSYEAKLSSYDMAASNVSMGMDLLAVAQDTISSMQDHGARLHALITQARNGTYGAQSLQALTQEAGALISEIDRMYSNAEYNGINLFNGSGIPDWAKELKKETTQKAGLTTDLTPKANGFIADIITVTPDIVVSEVSALSDAIANNTKIGIANADVLAELATLVNSGTNCAGKTITLTDDIDLSDYQDGSGWTAIGTDSNKFKGTFDGQGHKITGLVINKSSVSLQGLFGYITSGSIKNVGIVDCNVKGEAYTGGLVGKCDSSVNNSYVTGIITGQGYIGGLIGESSISAPITNCYAKCSVTSPNDFIGGLIGRAFGNVSNSFCTGNITGRQCTGGLVGCTNGNAKVNNCYAICTTKGNNSAGGLVGSSIGQIINSYAEGNVIGSGNSTGGLVGKAQNTINNSFSTVSVEGKDSTGGLVGYSTNTITNSYSTGNVTGKSSTGGLIGNTTGYIANCFATGNVSGTSVVGGLLGYCSGNAISNSYATGNVTANNWAGGLVGRLFKTSGTTNLNKIYASGEVNCSAITAGSLIGGVANTSDGETFGTVNIKNAFVSSRDLDIVGFEGKEDGAAYESGQMSSWLANIKRAKASDITLQVGIYGDNSSQIKLNTGFEYDLSSILTDIKSDDAYNAINTYMTTLSDKATEMGSVSNRLESSLDSILVNMENVTSSLSTIKDADVATTSSQYIKMQIFQQASATLLATANQSPSIALQLI